MTTPRPPDAIVVGGGVAGLAAAAALCSRSHRVLLLEAADRVGGVVRTERLGPWCFELGPNTVLERDPLPELLRELDLTQESCRVPVRDRSRFVWHGGRLHRVPRNPVQLLTSRLFSWRAKVALLTEPWRRSPPLGEETIAEFVRRRLTAEWLHTLVGPFVSGVYAGDPEQLAARWTLGPLVELEARHGSVLRGLRASRRSSERSGAGSRAIVSFPGGLRRLVEELAARAGEVRTGVRVDSISRSDGGGYRVEAAGETFRTPRLVLATPAGVASDLLLEATRGESAVLGEISYAPLAVAGLGFRADSFQRLPEGTGFLAPRGGDLRILGCLCASNLFPDRAPAEGVNLTAFLGGALDPDPVSWSDDRILEQARRDLSRVFGIHGAPEVTVCRRWERAIPQYDKGHRDRLDAVDRWLTAMPGLALAGSYLRGVALPDAIASGRRAAERVGAPIRGLVDCAP